ncbi:DNA recombination protein RmuC [Labedella endophytica]|uniref:DNA recombination protein RmuC n=1 Tax=Labedella endophytica TaxID=1523160 RepID=A0A3S1CQR1_9MICO|nr:DNA recombination protein RmuC [Labedella endophytica]
MDPILLLIAILALVAGAAIGFVLGGAAARARPSADPSSADPALLEARAEASAATLRAEEVARRSVLEAELAAMSAALDGVREQLDAERSERAARELRERNERRVLEALAPVRDSLQTMQRTVADLEQQRSEQLGSLAEQLAASRQSDEHLRATTESLASALRSNSTRGVWGETQLRRVVEVAGLTQHVDFDLQHSITTDGGSFRPDMVVRLPGGAAIAVDAKVPLEHFLTASSIPVTATGEEAARRSSLIDRHVRAVRSHVDALSKKAYWQGFTSSPEFVVAFVPSESLLSAALEADPSLLDYAFGKRVALASPVTLWSVLKTVASAWQQHAVTDEAKRLLELGSLLYDRLGTLAGHADGLRRSLERTVDSYNRFANSLETRVLVTARQFPGIDETKLIEVPQTITQAPRKLTAAEFESGATDADSVEESQTGEDAAQDAAAQEPAAQDAAAQEPAAQDAAAHNPAAQNAAAQNPTAQEPAAQDTPLESGQDAASPAVEDLDRTHEGSVAQRAEFDGREDLERRIDATGPAVDGPYPDIDDAVDELSSRGHQA